MACLICLLVLCLMPFSVFCQSYNPLIINQPSVSLLTKENGDIGLRSGAAGDVLITPGVNGKVFLDGVEIIYLIEMIQSEPPVWQTPDTVSTQTPYGYLGSFNAGDQVTIQLGAVDPEGMSISYARIAGSLPPGLSLDGKTGVISGLSPDSDATYIFTVRATDAHGKYADNRFRIVTRGYDGCSPNPCQNEGVCTDDIAGVTCACVQPRGGKLCDVYCVNNPLGIQQNLQYISDAQLTDYKSYSTYDATGARLDNSRGWIGQGSDSYVQIDFGNVTDIYRVDTQYYNSNYYMSSYILHWSQDGNSFYPYTDYTGAVQSITGPTGSGTYSTTLPSILSARYVRVIPTGWSSSYYPGMRVEMYGCYRYEGQ